MQLRDRRDEIRAAGAEIVVIGNGAAHFARAFPQLATLRFPYRWGGAIDTTSRLTRRSRIIAVITLAPPSTSRVATPLAPSSSRMKGRNQVSR